MRAWLWAIGLGTLLLTAGPGAAPAAEPVRLAQHCLNGLGFDAGAPDGMLGPRTQAALEQFAASRGIPKDPPGYPQVRRAVLRECGKESEGAPPALPSSPQVREDGWQLAATGRDMAESVYAHLQEAYAEGRLTPAAWDQAQQRYGAWQQAHRDLVARLEAQTAGEEAIRQASQKVTEQVERLLELVAAPGLGR